MKAHLIDTHLLVLRSSTKVKVKYQGRVSQKMGVSGALVFHKRIMLMMAPCNLQYLILSSPLLALSKGTTGLHSVCLSVPASVHLSNLGFIDFLCGWTYFSDTWCVSTMVHEICTAEM